MRMNEMAEYIRSWRESKGFHTPGSIDSDPQTELVSDGDMMLGKLMLVVTELSEAAEAVRHEDIQNFEEEVADTFIRLLDICATVEIDIERAIMTKMAINEGRKHLHGKKTAL